MSSFDNSMMRYLIGRSRIKFSVLDDLFRELYIPQSRVVVHLDASAVLYRIYRERDLSTLNAVDKNVIIRDLVVSFLNVVGHYRRYIMTRLQKTNDVLIYFNTKTPSYQTELFSDYRKSWYGKLHSDNPDYTFLNSAVKEAFRFIKSLTPYFEGIYIIDGNGVDDYTAMYSMIASPGCADFYHIIFSQNMLATQMIGPAVSQLYNKRDDSYMITNGTAFKNGILKGRKTAATEMMKPKMLPFIWCLGGCSDIDMKKTRFAGGIADTVKMLNPLVDQRIVTEDMSIQSFVRAIGKLVDGCAELRVSSNKLEERHKVLDLSASAAAITDSQRVKLAENIIDLYDQSGLEEINDKLALMGDDTELLDITNLNMSTSYEDELDMYPAEFIPLEELGWSI